MAEVRGPTAYGPFTNKVSRAELPARGVEVSEVQEFPWGSFVSFRDPDGNGWSVQQVPARG